MIRVRVRYTGWVQGVGFRATARSVAESAPISGWVRNEPDGSVTLEAQGEGAAVEAYLAGVRDRLGRFVRTEKRVPVPMEAGERGFEITRLEGPPQGPGGTTPPSGRPARR